MGGGTPRPGPTTSEGSHSVRVDNWVRLVESQVEQTHCKGGDRSVLITMVLFFGGKVPAAQVPR